ncbi:secretion protein HlyD family protein [Methylocella silvestris BL2]|uniref:Secretion protein HlyD family protein n=1 Tax=Methylocella silvestris (strain DSM 15510 / CIP 108128 / LMG 27833 / NCIMB 13906 / BL2) TaxID=395965 RepID=B8ERS5_METSB|nr:HlyD family efflux transporter periplasmic adaptor subunit [Methylocella silvestris]ACK51623.1 secretion protein HlyD family protein [Methylocella silvestris BL2]
MSGRSSLRPALLVGLAILAGGAFTLVYRSRPVAKSAAEPLGIVRETEIRIAPEINGRLAEMRVVAGQRVAKGDLLASLSNPELEASVVEAKAAAANARAERNNVYSGVRKEQVDIAAEGVRIAEANLTLAQQQFARLQALASKDYATQQKFDEGAAEVKKAQAALVLRRAIYARDTAGPTAEERASADAKVRLAEASLADLEAKLSKTTIRAPVDGTVRLLVGTPGEVIAPGQPIMTLEAGRERWFTFTIREDALDGLAIGAPLWLRDAKGERIETKVAELRPLGEFAVWRAARAVGDHDLNSFLLRAEPVSATDGFEPGMTVWLDRGKDAGR